MRTRGAQRQKRHREQQQDGPQLLRAGQRGLVQQAAHGEPAARGAEDPGVIPVLVLMGGVEKRDDHLDRQGEGQQQGDRGRE
jgi:hypothetical protein